MYPRLAFCGGARGSAQDDGSRCSDIGCAEGVRRPQTRCSVVFGRQFAGGRETDVSGVELPGAKSSYRRELMASKIGPSVVLPSGVWRLSSRPSDSESVMYPPLSMSTNVTASLSPDS